MNYNEYKSLKYAVATDIEDWIRTGAYDDIIWTEDEDVPWDEIVADEGENEVFDEVLLSIAPKIRGYHLRNLSEEDLQDVIDFSKPEEISCMLFPFGEDEDNTLNNATHRIIMAILLNFYDGILP